MRRSAASCPSSGSGPCSSVSSCILEIPLSAQTLLEVELDLVEMVGHLDLAGIDLLRVRNRWLPLSRANPSFFSLIRGGFSKGKCASETETPAPQTVPSVRDPSRQTGSASPRPLDHGGRATKPVLCRGAHPIRCVARLHPRMSSTDGDHVPAVDISQSRLVISS